MIRKFNPEKYDLTSPKGLSEAIAEILSLHKGKDISIVDLDGKTIIADYFVIASATSTTAVRALAGNVEDELAKTGLEPTHRDVDGKWVALDYGSVIVHVFYHETRDFYNVERLWADGSNVKKILD
jgi:ribosome-associated protein